MEDLIWALLIWPAVAIGLAAYGIRRGELLDIQAQHSLEVGEAAGILFVECLLWLPLWRYVLSRISSRRKARS